MNKITKVFDKELELISDNNIKEFVKSFLLVLPEWLWDRSASSSSKYHPEFSNGPGGLVKHIKAAVKILCFLLKQVPVYDNDSESRDLLIAAMILHDCCKYVDESDAYTKFEHPKLGGQLIREFGKQNAATINYDKIARLVEVHMGRYSQSKYSTMTLDEPQTLEELLMHLADNISAQLWVSADILD